jgi:hypothetical protein
MYASRFCLLLSSRAPSLTSRSGRSTFAPPAGIVWRVTGKMERNESARIRPRYGWRFLTSSIVFNWKNSYLIQYFNREQTITITRVTLCLLLQIQIYHPHVSTPTWLYSGGNNWWEQWIVFISCFCLKIIQLISALGYKSGVVTVNIGYLGCCLKRTDVKEWARCFRVGEKKEIKGLKCYRMMK